MSIYLKDEQDIKEKYLKYQNEFELLREEVIGCARQVKIWLAIAEAKEKFEHLNYEPFFAWIQNDCVLKAIAIDRLKICKAYKYIKSVLESVLSDEQYKNLIKYSQVQAKLNKLEKIVNPLKKWRDKRYAHLDNEEVENVDC